MTIDDALKVIDLNIDKLNGSMQMAVRTLLQDKTIYEEGFTAGLNWQKEKDLKDAVEVDVADLNGDIYNYCIEEGLTDEDKVKIIIVKEDSK